MGDAFLSLLVLGGHDFPFLTHLYTSYIQAAFARPGSLHFSAHQQMLHGIAYGG